jgi:hypothetical protein
MRLAQILDCGPHDDLQQKYSQAKQCVVWLERRLIGSLSVDAASRMLRFRYLAPEKGVLISGPVLLT